MCVWGVCVGVCVYGCVSNLPVNKLTVKMVENVRNDKQVFIVSPEFYSDMLK